MENIDVTSIEIRDYALSQGWTLVREALRDGLFVLNSPNNDYTQLIFPKDDSIVEFVDMAKISLQRLSETYKIPFHKLIEDIREVNDDVISLRYYSERKIVNSISFEEAIDAIEATRQLLLSAASSIVNPTIYHSKLNRTEPLALVKKTRFRHTQEGSFITKISCPFELTDASEATLFPDAVKKPLSRSTFEHINYSSLEILEAIESDSIRQLYESQLESGKPTVSYNFCDALTKLYDEERELPFQLIFNWSKASSLKFPVPTINNRIHFPFSLKTKIEEVKEYFAPRKKDISGTFYGTVETLDGLTDENNERSGPVVLSVFYEGEVFKTRLSLNAEQYKIAIEAHGKGGAYVQVKGDLKRGKRSNSIENLSEFKLSE